MHSRIASVRAELAVPLYRNAYALMLNTGVNSVLGLVYWVVAARTYPAAEVGRGSALVSLMMVLSMVAQLNLGQALIRFLPRGGAAGRRFLLGTYAVAVPLSGLVAAVVVAYCSLVLPPSDPLYLPLGLGAWFVVATMAWSVFNLQDAALTGLRAAVWVPVENGLYGVAKLAVLVTVAGAGVFVSWTAPVLVLLVPVTVLLLRRVLPRHAGTTELPSRRTLTRYVAGDYAGSMFTQVSTMLLPVLVVALLGPEQSSYLLPAQTIFTALGLLSLAITSSLVVEAARDASRAADYARAVLRRIAATVLPAALVLAVAAPWVLALFGPQYRANGTLLLQLLMISTLPRIPVLLYASRCRLDNRTGRLAVLQAGQAAVLVGGTVALAGPLGLVAVGWSALASQVLPALVLTPSVVRWLRHPRPTGH